MKILLIEPAKAPATLGGEEAFVYEPLALEYLAAGVTDHQDVRILDLRLENHLPQTLAHFQPDVVGITAYTVHVNTVKRLFEQIKALHPDLLTVVGGHHATVAPEDFLSPAIDLIVMGEGVFVFQQIVARREQRQGYDGIPGLAFVRNGRLVKTAPSLNPDLDTFPWPARNLTTRYRRHYFSEWMKPLASIRTSKGCPYRCNFCALWKVSGGRYLARDPEQVVQELSTIDEEYVFFADDESLVDADRMRRLALRIQETGIRKRYFLYGRSDTIARNPALLALWRDAGLERVFVGLEFCTDRDLEAIRKGSTTADNERAVKILQDLDIEVYASLIVRPEFDREDFAALRQYVRDLELTFATYAALTPLPGTDLWNQVVGQLITRDYDYFDFVHTLLPTKLPLKDFYEEYYNLYRKAIPATRQVAMLKKFPLREIPATVVRSYRVLNRLRKAYQDYN